VIEPYAFSVSGLTSIEIPGNVKTVGKSAFAGCSSLETVKINDGVTLLQESVFSNCNSLRSIYIPASVTQIGTGIISSYLRSNVTIYGVPGSTAQTYAQANGIKFQDVNYKPVTNIQLNETSTSILKGSSRQLSVTLTPNDASNKGIIWRSSNTKVATVDTSGRVTGKKAGNTVVTATSVDGGKTASCSVRVNNVVAVKSVALSKKTLKLDGGQSTVLTANIKPSNATDKSVSWKSSNTGIATVDATGKVDAVKEGKVTISATSNSGKKTGKCTVSVVSPVTSIIVPQATVFLPKGATATLNILPITADGSNAKLTWKSSKPKIISVDKQGKVKAKKTGQATITVKADNGKSANITVIGGKGQLPTSLTVNNPPSSNVMNVGNTLILNIGRIPIDAQGVIAFQSSNPRVLSVNTAGVLIALERGDAVITVMMGAISTTLKITVQ